MISRIKTQILSPKPHNMCTTRALDHDYTVTLLELETCTKSLNYSHEDRHALVHAVRGKNGH